jgi:hypothetical protein
MFPINFKSRSPAQPLPHPNQVGLQSSSSILASMSSIHVVIEELLTIDDLGCLEDLVEQLQYAFKLVCG